MAQPPHKPSPPPPPKHPDPKHPSNQPNQKPKDDPKDDHIHAQGQGQDKHIPLRDPSEGKSPAVIGHDVTREGVAPGLAPGMIIGVRGEPIEDGERDPDTIAEEQRRRSAEIEAKGIEAWKAERDERTDEEKAGVQVGGLRPGARPETHEEPQRRLEADKRHE